MANYRIPVLEQFSWQPPIISRALSAPPGSPVKGDRYIVGSSPTGDWTGHENHIATYSGTGWLFDIPADGWILFAQDEDRYIFCDGGATIWTPLTATPKTHHMSHEATGGDPIKLDDLEEPDDNTDLNASPVKHGLLPKLGGGTTNFLRADGTWAAPPGPAPTPTGTGFRHVTGGVEDAASKLVENADVAAAAGIAESKLALNYATHSPANDPTADQKAALAGTSGTPSATNKYVTDEDGRIPEYDSGYKCLTLSI